MREIANSAKQQLQLAKPGSAIAHIARSAHRINTKIMLLLNNDIIYANNKI
jgi:hypothetical protein